MTVWFAKNLGDGILAGEPLGQIEGLLRSAYAKAGNPKDFAAFIRHESEGRLHCEVKIWLCPDLPTNELQ